MHFYEIMNMRVPFVDFEDELNVIGNDIERAIKDVIISKKFILGPKVELFENDFARHCGSKHAIGVSSGTAALHLALESLNIKEGDEVIIPANTYIATALAVSYTNAKPVLVDIDESTYNIHASKIRKSISDKTKAILPVHLYGQPCNIDSIVQIAKESGIKLVWDACQAHGAFYKGRNVGSLDDIVCFSFYPSKNLGAIGDGGIITTNNGEIAERIRQLRNYGQERRYYHKFIGYNARLDEVQAAILDVKLLFLDEWNDKRIKTARQLYNNLLKGVYQVKTPIEIYNVRHVYHLYVVRAKNREKLQAHLKSKDIDTLIHYPIPIHLQEAYSNDGYNQINLGYKKGDFPVTEKCADEILSLPMYPEIKEEQVRHVADSIKEFYAKDR